MLGEVSQARTSPEIPSHSDFARRIWTSEPLSTRQVRCVPRFFFLRFSLLWWQDAKREIERWDSLSSAHHFSCPFFWIFQSCWKPLAIQTQVDSAGSTKYPCRPNKSLDRPWGIYTPRGAVPPSEMRLLHIDADDSASNCLHCFFPWFSHGGNGGEYMSWAPQW